MDYENHHVLRPRTEEISPEVRRLFTQYEHLSTEGCTAVWKARERETYDEVSIKKQFRLFLDDTNSKRVYREIFYLHALRDHSNFIKLLHVLREPNRLDLYLIYPYMNLDVQTAQLSPSHIEYVTKQLLLALAYLHSAGLRHGSLQPSSVLLTAACEVRLSDFARCRPVGDLYSAAVDDCPGWQKAAWYYCPEITIGSARRASTAEDMWALGATIGEVMSGAPLFPGTSTLNQIGRIMETIVAPTEAETAALSNPRAVMMLQSVLPPLVHRSLEDLLLSQSGGASPAALDFVAQCLRFGPAARASAQELLKHEYLADLLHPDPEEEAALLQLYVGAEGAEGGLQLPVEARAKNLRAVSYRELIDGLADQMNEERRRKD